jgi:hypothetical protein
MTSTDSSEVENEENLLPCITPDFLLAHMVAE